MLLPVDGVAELVARLRDAGCVFAEEEAAVLVDTACSDIALEAMVRRRIDGEPLEYVIGWASFAGLRIRVVPGVFVPRRRTELLVEEASRHAHSGDVVVDLCCGSGAIGAAVASRTPGILLFAADIDERAVACARENLASYDGTAYQGDLFDALPPSLRGSVNVVVVNAPYVPTDELALMPAEARDHEPRSALDGGPDGLDVIRQVVAASPEWLARAGHLIVEVSPGECGGVAQMFERVGLAAAVTQRPDIGGTAVIGTAGETTHRPAVQAHGT